jgi:hypothetical protein
MKYLLILLILPICLFSADYDVTEIDVLEHDTVYGRYNSLVQIDETHYMLAYTGADDGGFIKTFRLGDESSGWSRSIMGITPASIMGVDVESINSVMGVE